MKSLNQFIVLLCIGLLFIGSVFADAQAQDKGQNQDKECVILLHGLARSENSMNLLAQALEKDNYTVINHGYESTDNEVDALAAKILPEALGKCAGTAHVNFVTHSMGGIILRAWLANNDIHNLRNVVMLGPPNQGSEVVDKLGDLPGFALINGPAGKQLGTGAESLPKQLGPVNFTLGVIAGSDSFNPILSTLIPGDDDGKVSIDHTKVEGMTEHIVMPVSHTFMMRNQNVIAQTLYFLKHGHFHKETENPKNE